MTTGERAAVAVVIMVLFFALVVYATFGADPASTVSTVPTIESQKDQANALNWNTIILAFFGLLTAIASTVGTVLIARMGRAVQAGTDTAVAAQKAATATAVSVEKVHVAVNSERTKMMEKLDQATAVILALSREIATLKERAVPTPNEKADP